MTSEHFCYEIISTLFCTKCFIEEQGKDFLFTACINFVIENSVNQSVKHILAVYDEYYYYYCFLSLLTANL